MKRIGFAGLMLVALLFGAQVASAQEGWPGCPWGYAYDLVGHGNVTECGSCAENRSARNTEGSKEFFFRAKRER